MSEPEKRKLICDEIIDKLQESAQCILNEYAEPDIIMTIVSWNVGQNDFPFGSVAIRNVSTTSPKSMTKLLDQLRKAIVFTSESMSRLIDSYDRIVKNYEQKINQLKKEERESHRSTGDSELSSNT